MKRSLLSQKPPAGSARAVFSRRLSAWRRGQGLTMNAVSEALGITESAYSLWESGRRFPCAAHFDALAAMTGLPACTFLCMRRTCALREERGTFRHPQC